MCVKGNANIYASACMANDPIKLIWFDVFVLSLSLCRMMFGGLGQLCDGVLGGNDFMESKELRVWPGYDYVGWSQDVLGQPAVDIEFHFEKTRIFHTMQVSVCVYVCGTRKYLSNWQLFG